jgi:type VI secretion system protein VasD
MLNALKDVRGGLRPMMMACAFAALAACSSTAKLVASPYVIELKADENVNPNGEGRASPIQVLVYEMKSANAFESSNFFALQSNPQTALGAELLHTEQIILKPGQVHAFTRKGDVQAQAVGLVAAYRELEGRQWRLTVPLPEPQSTNIYKIWQFSPNEERLRIRVGKQGLEIIERDRPWFPSLF